MGNRKGLARVDCVPALSGVQPEDWPEWMRTFKDH